MEDKYQYQVYFDCENLDGEQRKRIEKYFHIRRKSGGGDCGPVTNISDTVCRISFKERDAQQRVLQRSRHVLECSDGPLVLTVRDTLETTTKSDGSKKDAMPVQTTLAPSLPTCGDEYELKRDSYLLQFLKESPLAAELEKRLASVGCSAQLYPEEERVVVRSLAQPGSAGDTRSWKAEVEELFGTYICHYEMDPHKVKALLEPCISSQTTDEVKVYSEISMAVVVGKKPQVEAMLADVAERPSRQSEKRTTIHRLGEAKMRLLWKEIETVQLNFPGITVMQGKGGQLVLEGSVKEILKAGDWISEKERLVLERKVSHVGPLFLSFLKKAYGNPALLVDFLGVRDEVEMEFRDTELCFLTLSANKLDATERKFHAKLMEAEIAVPTISLVSAQSKELREKLRCKKNEVNQDQTRVEVRFVSESRVCLLGHTREVEELSKIITQFALDQSIMQSIVHLPFSGLEVPEFLQLHGYDCAGVAFHPVPSSTGPAVMLEGPSDKVTEVRSMLISLLDSFLQDFVPSGEKDKDNPLNITPDLASLSLREVNTTVARYSLCDGLQVRVCEGDITKQDADIVVNAANEHLEHSTGVAAALSKAGGPQVQEESRALMKQIGKLDPGEVVVTTAGNLHCKKLLHAVGPVGGRARGRERALVEETVRSALCLTDTMGFKSIAIPCIGSGQSGVPAHVCSEAIVNAVKAFGSVGGRRLRRIILIDNRGEVVMAMRDACDRLLQGSCAGNGTPRLLELPLHTSAQDDTAYEASSSSQEPNQPAGFKKHARQPDQILTERRIILLGKTGNGKSHLANTIFGEEVFLTDDTPTSGTRHCQAKTKTVNGQSVTLVDTPGFFDTRKPEEEMKPEIVGCITECAPGPHAFLIVLKVEKFTSHEQETIDKISQYFSPDALKYAVIVFTHGENLSRGGKIEEFVSKNQALNDLVQKCGGRCHVVDNKHWNNKERSDYRCNQVQVEGLLKTIDKLVRENNGACYSNEMLQAVEEEVQREMEKVRQSSSGAETEEVIRGLAKKEVSNRLLIRLAGTGTGVLLGALCGVAMMLGIVVTAVRNCSVLNLLPGAAGGGVAVAGAAAAAGAGEAVAGAAAAGAGEAVAAAAGSAGLATAGVAAGVVAAGVVVAGGAYGGVIGYEAAEEAETPLAAAEMAANAVINKVKDCFNGKFV